MGCFEGDDARPNDSPVLLSPLKPIAVGSDLSKNTGGVLISQVLSRPVPEIGWRHY
jgi:hypothetical protein